MLFLRTNEQHAGTFVFVDDYKSAIRIADSPSVTRLLDAQSLSGKPEEQIASLLTASLETFSGRMLYQSLSDLVGLQGKQAGPAIKTLLDHSQDPVTRGQALEALIHVGDYSRLAEAAEYLNSERESDTAVLNAKKSPSYQMSHVRDAELVAKYCIPLLRHPSDFVRRDAAYAVRKAKLRSAVPELLKGLEDSDPDTRYHCLMGLAGILGRDGDWAPSKEVYEKSEPDYIRRWKTWWEDEGQFFLAEPPPRIP